VVFDGTHVWVATSGDTNVTPAVPGLLYKFLAHF
jgi:hypothetical protein